MVKVRTRLLKMESVFVIAVQLTHGTRKELLAKVLPQLTQSVKGTSVEIADMMAHLRMGLIIVPSPINFLCRIQPNQSFIQATSSTMK